MRFHLQYLNKLYHRLHFSKIGGGIARDDGKLTLVCFVAARRPYLRHAMTGHYAFILYIIIYNQLNVSKYKLYEKYIIHCGTFLRAYQYQNINNRAGISPHFCIFFLRAPARVRQYMVFL